MKKVMNRCDSLGGLITVHYGRYIVYVSLQSLLKVVALYKEE